MAPLGANADRSVWTTNSELTMYATALGICTTMVLLLIVCACRKSKTQREKEQREKAAAAAPPEPAPEPVDAKTASQKSTSGKSLLNLSAKGSKLASSTRVPSEKSSIRGGVAESKSALGQPKKTSEMGKAPPPPVKLITKLPTPTAASTRAPKMPAPATKSFRPAPAPAAEADGDFLFKAPKTTIHPSMITPGAGVGGRQPGKAWPPSRPDMDLVRFDDPAYRSLAGLDDAFGPTQAVGSVYGGGKTSADSAMPSTAPAVSITTRGSTTSGSTVASGDEAKGKGKKKGKKKTPKKKKK